MTATEFEIIIAQGEWPGSCRSASAGFCKIVHRTFLQKKKPVIDRNSLFGRAAVHRLHLRRELLTTGQVLCEVCIF